MSKFFQFRIICSLVFFVIAMGCTAIPENEDEIPSTSSEIAEEAEFSEDSFGEDDFGEDDFSQEDSFAEESFEEDSFAQEDFSEDTFVEDDFSEDGFSEDAFGDDIFAEEEVEESQDNPVAASTDDFLAEDTTPSVEDDFAVQENFTEEPAGSSEGDQSLAYVEPDNSTVTENRVVGLDFLANQNGGTIVISTESSANVRQRKNLSTGQHIIEVDNIVLPEKFQRPYDTREFGGAIGLFQAYQEPGSKTARFIIQLSDDAEPMVSSEGNSIMVLASNKPEQTMDQMAINEAEAQEEISEPTVDLEKIKRDEKLLGKKSIEDFLIGNTNYYGKKINIELVNTDILRVFDIIAEQSNLNIVVSEDVKGKITLKLRSIPWDQALMVVLQSKQLGYVKNGNILRIAPLKTIEKESQEARKVIEAQLKLQPTKVKIYPVSFAKADQLQEQITSFLTEGRGSVKADLRTNSLVVTDIVEVLDRVGELIKRLDTETPQVLMEAKFVEATEEFSRDVNLNIVSRSDTSSTDDSGGSVTTNFRGPDASAEGTLAGLFATFTGTAAFGNLSAKLDLYEKRNLAKVISSPRVVGLNNETAKITQTNQKLNVSVTGAATEEAVPTTTVTPIDITTDLSITPQITAEGGVLMDMTITRDVAGETQTLTGGATSTPVNTRSAKTKVLVPNGDTVVIGGVYSFDNSNLKVTNPYLSKIPILGTLFTDKTSSYNKSELMIFVTPRVLNIEKAFNRGGIIGQGTDGSDGENSIF